MDINDITKQLAAKFSGLNLEKEKPAEEPEIETASEYMSRSSLYNTRRTTIQSEPHRKLWPSERMQLDAKRKPMPRRAPCRLNDFTEDDLEWMFETPVKRNCTFEDWLEIIGLPRDLDEAHDGCIYGYAARNYLLRKQESHRR